MQLVVLGRQPLISLAELESLYGADKVHPLGSDAALLSDQADIDRLGGAIKIAEIIGEVDNSNHSNLAQSLAALVTPTEGKFNLGVSWYDATAAKARATALEIKKILKKRGQKVRVVPNSSSGLLSSAQVWHNRLDKEPNVELLIVKSNTKLTVARTTQVQDIESYAKRDHGRPARDARVGMLPPKLAQIMINLSGLKAGRILDPFCGTGVVLQEAGRLGYSVYGSDIESRMVEYSRQNLNVQHIKAALETADARKHEWQPPIDAIVSEAYLGPPLSSAPLQSKIDEFSKDSGQLMQNFLKNIYPQLVSGAPLVLATPVWQSNNNRKTHSTVVDQIESLGYTRRSFKTAKNEDLVYRRPDQVVGRELLVLQRK